MLLRKEAGKGRGRVTSGALLPGCICWVCPAGCALLGAAGGCEGWVGLSSVLSKTAPQC